MFNNWESALADNTSKDLFGTKFKEETCKSSKKKKKKKRSRKKYSKVLHQAIGLWSGRLAQP